MEEYTGYKTVKVEFEAMDIPSMSKSNREQHRAYVEETLFFQDHGGVVRFVQEEFPIATNKEQIDNIIQLLQEWREKADD